MPDVHLSRYSWSAFSSLVRALPFKPLASERFSMAGIDTWLVVLKVSAGVKVF